MTRTGCHPGLGVCCIVVQSISQSNSSEYSDRFGVVGSAESRRKNQRLNVSGKASWLSLLRTTPTLKQSPYPRVYNRATVWTDISVASNTSFKISTSPFLFVKQNKWSSISIFCRSIANPPSVVLLFCLFVGIKKRGQWTL